MKSIADVLVGHDIVRTSFRQPFQWTSGILSPIYCDARELISIPEARDAVVEAFLDYIEDHHLESDIISGTATAGIPWASFVAQSLDKPMLYVRSKPKGHGAGKMVEGRGEHHQKILVVEDAISTAGSSIKSAEALRKELEATVTDILAIFSWSTPLAEENAKKAGIKLHPLTNYHEIVTALEAAGKINSAERESLERFKADPMGWATSEGVA
ncbi:MAG TPA: orotate phosphoribosyltransferase [Candidatus Gracilibacteria bacterium]